MKKIFTVAILGFLFLSCADDFYFFAKYGPKPKALYLFYGGSVTGNMGGTDGADFICRSIINEPDFFM